MSKKRCDWAKNSKAYLEYHDQEWGTPVHDDQTLFEFLTLEGAQAGLSWSTILALHTVSNNMGSLFTFLGRKIRQ